MSLRGKSNKLEDFDPDILKQLWCIRYLKYQHYHHHYHHQQQNLLKKYKKKNKTGIYSNVKILESEKGVGSGGEQEEIQSLKVSDMN